MLLKLTTFLILLLPIFSNAQQQYFSKRYDFNSSQYENGFNILPYDSGYISWNMSSLDSLSGRCKIVVNFLDSVGNILQTKVFDHSTGNNFAGGFGTICQTYDSGFAMAGSIVYPNGNSNATLWKFDHVGDTLWYREFGDTLYQSALQCKQTRDKGFIIAGITYSYSIYGDILLIKTDSTGLLLWEKHLGGIDRDVAFSIDTCFDGGFIIGGYTWSYGVNPLTDFANAYLIKTDSLGDFQWQTVLGDSYDDRFYFVLQCSDGNFISCGHFTTFDPFAHCCHGYQLPTIIKFDSLGSIIWQKSYGPALANTFLFKIKELSDGKLIACGAVKDTLSMIFTSDGLAIKVESNGDSLWYRNYDSFGPDDYSVFYDISNDSDDGLICTGWFSPYSPDTGTQDIWVLKLDSNGCEISNCLTSGIELISLSQKRILYAYPNPFISQVTIETTLTEDSKSQQLIISDIIGQKLKVYSLKAGQNQVNISTDYLQTGIYFASLLSEGKVLSTVRLMKTN
ncbi:MAG: T9SS type A sorting domain-containing protein [Bacteroidota bacterium]